MEEIEIGEYVRTKNGIIDEVIMGYGKYWNPNRSEKYVYCKYNHYNKEDIVKHSKQLIDLIEVGDFVNGYKISIKESTLLCTNVKGIDGSGYNVPISQYGDGIETILTKEQYANNCYENEKER